MGRSKADHLAFGRFKLISSAIARGRCPDTNFHVAFGQVAEASLKNNTPCRDKVVDHEVLSVQRNAPRWKKMLVKHGFMPTTTTAKFVTSFVALRSGLRQATICYVQSAVSFTLNVFLS